jgi:hypothetical protein
MTVYAGKQVEVVITKTTEGDKGAFIAQEVTLEPRHAIEGIDALNSDEIEAWADGLITYEFEEYTMKLIWDGGSGAKITITLTGTVFPEPSIASPKNAPSFITTRFRAKSASIAIE